MKTQTMVDHVFEILPQTGWLSTHQIAQKANLTTQQVSAIMYQLRNEKAIKSKRYAETLPVEETLGTVQYNGEFIHARNRKYRAVRKYNRINEEVKQHKEKKEDSLADVIAKMETELTELRAFKAAIVNLINR